jgi:uncharacterized membrane protein
MVERLRTSFSDRRLAVFAALVGLSGLVAGLVAFRVAYSHSFEDVPYLWNLFLAWIPFVLALGLYDGARRGMGTAPLVALGGLWLLFLPNAPYIATDVIWLGALSSGTYWDDPLLVATAAGIGLALGFLSLYLVQAVVSERLGRVAGWTVALGALVLSGLGVYLGRYERWNSWEVVTEPGKIFGGLGTGLLDPLAHPRPLALSTFFAVACCAGYAVFYSALRPQLRRLEER